MGRSSKLPDHPHVDTVLRYYAGCNAYDAQMIRSTLTDDMVHYWVDHPPVHGGDHLASFAAKSASRTRAKWSGDHMLVVADEMVVEWSMSWIPIGADHREILRGTEWLCFRDRLISEVRSYHANYHLTDPQNFELRGYPHAARGYAMFAEQ